MKFEKIWSTDPEAAKALAGEIRRQADHLEMIASENFVSEAVLEAAGVRLGLDYPQPLVDLGESRKAALAAYAELRGG